MGTPPGQPRRGETGSKAERLAARRQVLAAGGTIDDVAQELQRRWNVRPRTAYRHAYGWTQSKTAVRVRSAAMTATGIGDYERWPDQGRQPTPYALTVLAEVYRTLTSPRLWTSTTWRRYRRRTGPSWTPCGERRRPPALRDEEFGGAAPVHERARHSRRPAALRARTAGRSRLSVAVARVHYGGLSGSVEGGLGVLAALETDRTTRHQLKAAGLALVRASLWAKDCQTCGQPLGAATPALHVLDMDEFVSATLHHPRCQRPQWSTGTMPAGVSQPNASWHARTILLPLPRGPRPLLLLVNPTLELVYLERDGDGWSLEHHASFAAAGLVPAGPGLVYDRPVTGAAADPRGPGDTDLAVSFARCRRSPDTPPRPTRR